MNAIERANVIHDDVLISADLPDLVREEIYHAIAQSIEAAERQVVEQCARIVLDSMSCDCAAPDIGVGVLHEPMCCEHIGGFIAARIRGLKEGA